MESLCFLYVFHPMRECASEQIPATTPHRSAEKCSEPSEEVRIYVGSGACIQEEGLSRLVAHRGETAERVKYHFKEEVKARARESIRRRTIYAQARAQFDMGIMKKRRSLWMT